MGYAKVVNFKNILRKLKNLNNKNKNLPLIIYVYNKFKLSY